MGTAKPVNSREKVHDIALSNCVIDGLYLEFGVYQGKSINYISNKIKKMVFGFDSFDGLPDFWRNEYDAGTFALENLPKVNNNVTLIKGWFSETLPTFISLQNENIAYLHIDCDLYSSALTVFQNLKHKIVEGTIIVFDEYFNYPGWENDEFKAFQEFAKEKKVVYEYLAYNYLHQQVAIKIISLSSHD